MKPEKLFVRQLARGEFRRQFLTALAGGLFVL
jgi:hypothetical protein